MWEKKKSQHKPAHFRISLAARRKFNSWSRFQFIRSAISLCARAHLKDLIGKKMWGRQMGTSKESRRRSIAFIFLPPIFLPSAVDRPLHQRAR
jgi:hypothetical protein